MRRHPILLVLICSIALGSSGLGLFDMAALAQMVDSSVCEILANPAGFDGKTVRVKGTVAAGFEDFAIKDESCKGSAKAIWLAYPEGTKGKAGPVAYLHFQLSRNSGATVPAVARTPVKLDKNKDFKQFDSLLSTPYPGGGMCLGCNRYRVTATLVGRLDGVKEAGLTRDGSGKFIGAAGFGNLNSYSARLVLQSVADVVPQEIDYAKVAATTKDDSTGQSSGGDPVAAAHQAAQAFGAGSAAAGQLERAAAAYGNPGEDNGVNVGFAGGNEVSKSDGEQGSGNSPDGLLSDSEFNMDRLKGEGLSRAITHMGAHIADVRAGQSAADARKLEYGAWQTTVLMAIATRQKTLTLPGGYLIWNAGWAAADRSKLMGNGISDYLSNWELIGK